MDAAFAWADEPGEPGQPVAAARPDGAFEVWAENWDTVAFFWSVRRCWRVRPMGGVMGFDWVQLRSKMQLKRFDAERMECEAARLELMENAIMEVLG